MYYYLKGTLAFLTPDTAVVECAGVGYRLTVPASTVSLLSEKIRQTVTVYTHLSVREDAMELYGFTSEDERTLFRKLLSVSGVGPKAANAILSVLSVQELMRAIANGDHKAIARANGVGPKLAQRVVLELKDKLGSVLPDGEAENGTVSGNAVLGSNASAVVDTLTLYGFTREQIVKAMRSVAPELPLEELIAETLRVLAKNN